MKTLHFSSPLSLPNLFCLLTLVLHCLFIWYFTKEPGIHTLARWLFWGTILPSSQSASSPNKVPSLLWPLVSWTYWPICGKQSEMGGCFIVAQSCPILCDPMNGSMAVFPVLHYLPEFAQTHVHWVNGAIQPSYPLSPLSPPALNLSQHQGLFQ